MAQLGRVYTRQDTSHWFAIALQGRERSYLNQMTPAGIDPMPTANQRHMLATTPQPLQDDRLRKTGNVSQVNYDNIFLKL